MTTAPASAPLLPGDFARELEDLDARLRRTLQVVRAETRDEEAERMAELGPEPLE